MFPTVPIKYAPDTTTMPKATLKIRMVIGCSNFATDFSRTSQALSELLERFATESSSACSTLIVFRLTEANTFTGVPSI